MIFTQAAQLWQKAEKTAAMLNQNPDLDFLYYSNDMIGAGGLLYLLDKNIDIPGQIGLAGYKGKDKEI